MQYMHNCIFHYSLADWYNISRLNSDCHFNYLRMRGAGLNHVTGLSVVKHIVNFLNLWNIKEFLWEHIIQRLLLKAAMYLTGSYISLQCYIMYTHNIFATFNNEDFSSFVVAIFEKSWFSKELSIQEIVFFSNW